jgi:hypothetical protein
MEDPLITEYAGTQRAEIYRFYQYGSGGVRVLDAKKAIKRIYLFDPSSGVMTERDPLRQEKILRRFVFDRYGMLEETSGFGERPRTFRYENGGRQIAVREGGDYGAVGKILSFEKNGITETAWGRNGEIEHVYQFDAHGDTITIRAGGWYGEVERSIVFGGTGASVFYEPESFLQFLMFTEWNAKDRDDAVTERVAMIRGAGRAASGRSQAPGKAAGRTTAPKRTGQNKNMPRARASDDPGIDFIPAGDMPDRLLSQGPLLRRSSEISYSERRHTAEENGKFSRGGSAEIPLEERFERSDREPDNLPKGKSAGIPYRDRRGGSDR